MAHPAHVFAHALYEAGSGLVRDKITATLILAGVTLPMWHALLKSSSENAALLTPIVFFGVAILKLWQEWPSEEKRAALLAKLTPSAARVKSWLFVAAAIVSIGAVFLFVRSGSAKAAPAPVQTVSAPAGKRKRTDDDAGDEGEAESDDSDGPGAPLWFWDAKKLIGTEERLPNGRANPVVKAMFAAVDGFDPATVDCRNTAWCAVFVNFILAKRGILGTRSAMARSFSRSKNFTEINVPKIGCIVVMWRGQSDDGQSGHVGFYSGEVNARYIGVLGGNQGDAVSLAKFPKSRVIGYYWPRGKWQSKTKQGAAVAAVSGTGATGAVAYDVLADDTASKIPGVPDSVSLEAATKTAEQIQQSLEMSGHPKAMRIAAIIGVVLMAVTVGGALWAYYHRSQDQKNGF